MYSKEPKIRPAAPLATTALRGDGTPDDNDRIEIGPTALAYEEWAARGLTLPEVTRMRETRLGRVCEQLQARDYAGALLFDPLNIRYATDSSNMHIWVLHNPARAVFVSADGYVVLWDFHRCDHLSTHLPLVREIRGGAGFFYFETGDRTAQVAQAFVGQLDALMREHAGGNRRLAVDRMEIAGVLALQEAGVDIRSGQQVMEHARAIKSEDEVNAMRCAIDTCERAMAVMHQHLAPGISENELWAHLHAQNIKRGGEWIETRILNSGPRTNPWMQESGPRVVQPGDLLAFDTDLVGPYGMCADLSRTWYCGDKQPSDEQRRLYRLAHEHIETNTQLLRPGTSFHELAFGGHQLTEEFVPQRYGVKMHGIGLCDEFPGIYYPQDYIEGAFDYVVQPGMTFCVEAYFGAVGGRDGVKLEEQVLVTEQGPQRLSQYPYDERLLS